MNLYNGIRHISFSAELCMTQLLSFSALAVIRRFTVMSASRATAQHQ